MKIIEYTREMIPEVMALECRLREENPLCRDYPAYFEEIDEAYRKRAQASFDGPQPANVISLLARVDGSLVGRIEGRVVTGPDGIVTGRLDELGITKSGDRAGAFDALMMELRRRMKQVGVRRLLC